MMQFWKNHKFKIISLLVVLLAAFGIYTYYQGTKEPAVVEKTAAVERGSLIASISATGSLSAVDNVDINSKITGRIVEVYVKGQEKVTYVHMTPEKVARVVNDHIVNGRPVEEYTVGAQG